MQKRFAIIVFFFIALIVFFTTSCQKNNKKINEVVIWSGIKDIKYTLTQIAKNYENTHSNVKIKIIQIPFTDLQTKYQIAAPAYAGPDLLIAPHDWAGVLKIANLISPLEDNYNTKEFIQSSINAVKVDKKIYALPLYAETTALFYNLDVLGENFKPFNKFSDLIEFSKKLKDEKQIYGLVFDVNNFYFTWPIFSAFNVYIFKDNNWQDIGLSKENAIEAAYYLKQIVDSKIISESMNLDNAADLFLKNKAAIIINGPWFLKSLKKNKISYLIAQYPDINGKKLKPFIGFMAIYLNSRSKNKKSAKDFINYLSKKENQKLIYLSSGRIPVRKDLVKEAKKDKDIKGFLNSLNYGIAMPNTPAMTQVWAKMKDALTLINSYKGNDEKKEIEIILKRYVKDIKNAIKFMME